MPWCEACDRYLSPSTVHADGTCPTCGAAVEPGHAHDRRGSRLRALPWHTKLLLIVFAIYLLFRLGQGIRWLAGQL